ncbi:ABC transporter permease [Methylophaga sp. SB9B]|uniref:ABC transporter permease n=1 Tax=Methylophaga sp. SB9B TaxID=2570356 RepID=UPI001FFF5969|nr:ABC transporter permease [Methylophaga sp. SB9B]
MDFFGASFVAALKLLMSFDATVWEIIQTSVSISVAAAFIAALLAIPAGVFTALTEFSGKAALQHILNTLMAMPTVVIGLLLYGLFSRMGPLGELGLLYTQSAMIIAQSILIFPIMMNLTLVTVNAADPRLILTLKSLGADKWQQCFQVLKAVRLAVLVAILTGFGRAIGEVGAAMMLGGNIEGYTRTMTTAIALETSKGEFELALALGIVLLLIAFILNFALSWLNRRLT